MKREVKVFDKIINNFIESVDFKTYFPDYFSFVFLPFFFIGLFSFVKDKLNVKDDTMQISYAFLSSILILSLLGVHGKYGPFTFFPFIVLFINIGFIKIFNLLLVPV